MLALLTAVAGTLIPSSPAGAAAWPTPPPVQARTASTVTSVELPTVQIDDGVVRSLVAAGHTVFAGGSFRNARPAGAAKGTHLSRRTNLLAFNVTTGRLTSFAPTLNGPVSVVALSPDRKRLYVGGSFTRVNGHRHYKLAAFDVATGRLLASFGAQIGGSYVNAIATTRTAVYVGGLFASANGHARRNLAAFTPRGGALTWRPTTNRQVDAMVMSPFDEKVIVGGRFTLADGHGHRGLVALSPRTGHVLAWAATATVLNGDKLGKAGIYSLSRNGSTVYGTGWVTSKQGWRGGNLEGTFAAAGNTGVIRWIEDCHGDEYSSWSDGTQVYTVGHPHDCSGVGGYPQLDPAPGNLRHALAFTTARKGTLTHSDTGSSNRTYKDWAGEPAPALINWFPDFVTGKYTGQGQAAWALTGSGPYLVAGGEFPYVNGKAQYGLVRFARPSVAGTRTDGPRLSGSRWVPTASLAPPSGSAVGGIRVSIRRNYDRDNPSLTYQLRRVDGIKNVVSGTPIRTVTRPSLFWSTATLFYDDRSAVPGQYYTYQWTAIDADGNVARSQRVSLLAGDRFQRSVTDGSWGDADFGGAWAVAGPASVRHRERCRPHEPVVTGRHGLGHARPAR